MAAAGRARWALSLKHMFDPQIWAAVPFHFWLVVFFVLGAIVGSLLNVCIHRMPRGESIIFPPSHCPHCQYSIPWYLNIPLLTWVYLGGRCANCRAPISVRYFLVELLTGVAFLGTWLRYGQSSPAVALAYCLLLAGFIVATFIDFEHFIIPDEITIGGMVVGVGLSALVPHLHDRVRPADGLLQSLLGLAVGAGVVYAILRLGKLLFGRQRFVLQPGTRVIFTEHALLLPEQEIPYGEIFYRKSDAIELQAHQVELIDRCYGSGPVRLTPRALEVGGDSFSPESIPQFEVITDELVVPREAMGLGDVKFMGAIGAFLGWQAVLFSLMVSAVLGSAVGVALIAVHKRAWSSRIPYGPYIAVAATFWIFGGKRLVMWWWAGM
jgi:leader peptidase (prepilin peptidase)/N-methyltransferase